MKYILMFLILSGCSTGDYFQGYYDGCIEGYGRNKSEYTKYMCDDLTQTKRERGEIPK